MCSLASLTNTPMIAKHNDAATIHSDSMVGLSKTLAGHNQSAQLCSRHMHSVVENTQYASPPKGSRSTRGIDKFVGIAIGRSIDWRVLIRSIATRPIQERALGGQLAVYDIAVDRCGTAQVWISEAPATCGLADQAVAFA